MRLGDLDALKKTFENACIYGLPMNELYGAILKIIDNAPTVPNEYMRGYEAAEREYKRPQGEWIDVNGDGSLWKCNNCGEKSCCKGNYCLDCGAIMKGGIVPRGTHHQERSNDNDPL